MSGTYSAPIRVGARNTATFDGANVVDNTGVVLIGQTIPFSNNSSVTFAIPAGSLIDAIYAVFTTATIDPAATFTISIATSPAITFTSAALGAGNRRVDLSLSTIPVSGANVGTANVLGTANSNSAVGAQNGFFVIRYFGRNPNGTISAVGTGQTQ